MEIEIAASGSGLLDIADEPAVAQLLAVQRSMLARLHQIRALLQRQQGEHAAQAAEAVEELQRHTALLGLLQTDLAAIFRKLRRCRRALEERWPEAFQSAGEEGEEEGEEEGGEEQQRHEAAWGQQPQGSRQDVGEREREEVEEEEQRQQRRREEQHGNRHHQQQQEQELGGEAAAAGGRPQVGEQGRQGAGPAGWRAVPAAAPAAGRGEPGLPLSTPPPAPPSDASSEEEAAAAAAGG